MNSLGPDWQTISMLCVGIIITLIGAYAKSISLRVTKVEDRQSRLERSILKDYHDKTEINSILQELKASIKSLHERFDRAGFPLAATRNYDGNGDKG